jgi:hypothetical protein
LLNYFTEQTWLTTEYEVRNMDMVRGNSPFWMSTNVRLPTGA